MSDFPIVGQLNHARSYLSEHSHLNENDDLIDIKTIKVTVNWIAHKALTVVCLPINAAAMTIGFSGACVTACVIGGIKVAVFAISLGNYKLPISSRTTWLLERTYSATNEIFNNIGELLFDVLDIGYQGFRVVRWVCRRIWIGLEKASEKESGFTLREQILFSHSFLNDATRAYRINTESEDRSLIFIAKHTALSLFNIPVSIVIALGSGIIAPVFTAVYLSKALLYAGTNIHIPVPTYAGKAMEVSFYSGKQAIVDGVDIGRDVYVTLFKISSIFRFNVLATARDVIFYIPEAIFG